MANFDPLFAKMMSLKSIPIRQTAPSRFPLFDLPEELLRHVVDQLSAIEDLLSISLVSKRLRDATLPILYGCINLTLTTAVQKNGKTIIDFLLDKPRLHEYIRKVTIRDPPSNIDHLKAKERLWNHDVNSELRRQRQEELPKFMRLSTHLVKLSHIRIYSSLPQLLLVTAAPILQARNVQFTLGNINEAFPRITGGRLLDKTILQNLNPGSAHTLSFCFIYPYCIQEYDLDALPSVVQIAEGLKLTEMITTVKRFSRLRSLSVVVESVEKTFMHPLLDHDLSFQDFERTLPSLQELHLQIPLKKFDQLDKVAVVLLRIIPWSQLQRLSLSGSTLIEFLLLAVGDSLSKVKCLHLNAREVWHMPGCILEIEPLEVQSLRTGHQHYRQVWHASDGALEQTAAFLQRHHVQELMLEGYGVALSLRDVLSPRLTSLKIHMCEIQPNFAHANLRQESELRWLAFEAPNIEHLELDIASIGNLWHPTAVPGVDIDVRLYQILDALMTLPRLRYLRLFPQYYQGTGALDGTFRQPMTDDAAVRLFRHLKGKNRSLRMLDISSDNNVAQLVVDFEPMSWNMTMAGDKIVLTVHQAHQNYEQRQIWAVERRLRTDIRRFTYQKPYVAEFQGWLKGS